MKLSQVVRPGSGQFICEQNVLDLLDEKLSIFNHPVIVTGEKSYDAFQKHYKGGLKLPVFRYDGTASHEDMHRLAAMLPSETDCIVGIGGGKLLDTAKGTADVMGVEVVTVPTVLGTCAGYTPLSPVYFPDHTFKVVEYYERSVHLCLMDLNLLVESPKQYLMGGIGDTLAKWYEAQGITEHVAGDLPAMVKVGLQTAKVTQEILLNDTVEAIASLERKEVTDAFKRVAESIVAIAGTVGGFAGEYGRMAGAHAVHNGMSLVKETHAFEHGVKVAYGVLVQLVAAKKLAELETLIPFFAANDMPRKLSDFGINEGLEEKMMRIAAFASSPDETFRLAVPSATAESVKEAMEYLEGI